MNRWVLVAATLLTATALGVSAAVMARDEAAVLAGDEDARGLSETAEETYGEGDTNVVFHTLGEVAATARLVLRGRVVDVGQGDPEKYTDGSGVTRVPRLIVVDVKEVLSPSAMEQTPPSRIRIYDGFWENGTGYASDSLRWAQPGDEGYFLVKRGLDPQGERSSSYTLVSPAGRVLIADERPEHAPDGLWGHPAPATADEVRAALDAAVLAVRNGEAHAVRTKVCHPSVPGDENSEPVCVLD